MKSLSRLEQAQMQLQLAGIPTLNDQVLARLHAHGGRPVQT